MPYRSVWTGGHGAIMRRIFLVSSMIAVCSCSGGDDAVGAMGGGATDGGARGGSQEDSGSTTGTGPAPGAGDAGSPISADDGGGDGDSMAVSASDGAAVPEDAGALGPYGGDGPSTVTTVAFQVPSPNGTFTTTAYVPSAAGARPVVILSSGFFQNGAGYAPYASRLASWGVVTFLRDDPGIEETTPNVVSDVTYEVTTWLATTNADATSALYGKLDTSSVGLAGHSRGGQVSLLAGEGLTGKIRGVFGLDPVDSAMSGDPQARTTLATIGVPVAFIGETTDAADSGCAPGPDDFLVLYAAAASPAVAVTVPNADHTMFEDPASCSFCTLCTAGTANQPQVLSTAVRYLTAFFARQLLGDASVGAAFAGAGAGADLAAGLVQIQSK